MFIEVSLGPIFLKKRKGSSIEQWEMNYKSDLMIASGEALELFGLSEMLGFAWT